MQYGKKGDYDLYFFYDDNDQPLGFYYKDRLTSGRKFYFVLNAQGDVVQIRDSANKAVANYHYDAWGKLLSITNTNGIEQTFPSDVFTPPNTSIEYSHPPPLPRLCL